MVAAANSCGAEGAGEGEFGSCRRGTEETGDEARCRHFAIRHSPESYCSVSIGSVEIEEMI